MNKLYYRFFIVLTIGCLLLGSCNGQTKKPQKPGLTNNKFINHDHVPVDFNFRYAAGKATPGVVHIKSVFPGNYEQEIPDLFRDFFGGNNVPKKQFGSASGVIISDDGYIVTNNHVIDEAESLAVVLHDQRSYKVKVIGTDPETDLALLKIDEKNLSFIEFGNSDSLMVGDFVLAVGNPFNLASTVTMGIVSAKARNINLLTDRRAVESYIQTDAVMNPGNSGGALVDIHGKLIGITSAIASPTGAYAGYSFAIPIEIVKKSINDLLRYGKVMRGYLGISISDMDGEKAKMLGISEATGVIVDSLEKNGSAMKAGILKNDVIKKISGQTIETAPELRELIARAKPGEKLQLTIIRDGKEKTLPVLLMPIVEPAKTAVSTNEILKTLGITISDLTAQEKTKLQIPGGVKVVSISSGKVASQTDLRKGFIIIRINGMLVRTANEFLKQLKDKKGGVMLEGIYPDIAGIYYYAFGL